LLKRLKRLRGQRREGGKGSMKPGRRRRRRRRRRRSSPQYLWRADWEGEEEKCKIFFSLLLRGPVSLVVASSLTLMEIGI
jgi:hypothetical protein